MADTCRGCVYYRSLSENSPNLQHYCNYLLDTGEPRRCPAENCKKKLVIIAFVQTNKNPDWMAFMLFITLYKPVFNINSLWCV